MNLHIHLKPLLKGKVRQESWGGLYYYRDIPCINIINETAYFILSRCDGKTTLAEIDTELQNAYDAPVERLRADLQNYLLQAVRLGYIEFEGISLPKPSKEILELQDSYDKQLLNQIGVIGVGENELSAPIKVLLELTHNCNMKCVHCFANAACDMATPEGYLPGELTAAEWAIVIDKLAAAKVFDVFVSGGEPLIRKDIFEILSHVRSRNMGFCLLTNLTLLDDEKAIKLKELGCYKIEGNLDGPDALSYDEFRGLPGAFEATVKAIQVCQRHELPLRLNVTATKKNIFQLKEIVTTAVQLKIKELCVIPLEQGGRARENWHELALSTDEHVKLMDYYMEVARWVKSTYGNQIAYIGPCEFILDDRENNKIVNMIDPNRLMPMCGAGKFHCSIAPSGRVILCPTAGDLIKITPGDALRDDFLDIWHNADVFKAIRNSFIPGCRNCEYTNCGGGCQVNAYIKHGKVGLFPDTDCRKVYQAKMKKADLQMQKQQEASSPQSTAAQEKTPSPATVSHFDPATYSALCGEEIEDSAHIDPGFKYFIAPKSLVWEITSKCALQCSFCFGSYPKQLQNELTPDEKRSLALELAQARLYGINLSGGEPLLCDELPELVEIFRTYDIPVMIVTSGYNLTPSLAESLLQHPDLGLSFSLDAPVPEIHDELRGRKGAFATVINAIQTIQSVYAARTQQYPDLPPRFSALLVECVITRKNLAYVEQLIELSEQLGVVHLRIQPVVAIGRGSNDAFSQLVLSADEVTELKQRVLRIRESRYAEIQAGLKKPSMQIAFVDQSTHVQYGVRTGRNSGGILLPDGTLKPSAYLPYTFGSIRDCGGFMKCWQEGFKGVWRHPVLQSDLASVTSIKDLEAIARHYKGAPVKLALSDIPL